MTLLRLTWWWTRVVLGICLLHGPELRDWHERLSQERAAWK